MYEEAIDRLSDTARKISGAKLGQVVKKDLLKKANSRTPIRDPHLELNLSKMHLGDEGLQFVCEGLVEAIEKGAAQLEELYLGENDITAAGLVHLVDVIRSSSQTLKVLELQRNKITMEGTISITCFEIFLNAFRDQSMLHKLDLSSNELGDKGFEVFCRVYAAEPAVILPRTSIHADLSDDDGSLDDEEISEEEEPEISGDRRASSPNTSFSAHSTPSRSSLTYTRKLSGSIMRQPSMGLLHGMRSIPYILLSDNEVTDVGALHLSYVLPAHPVPDQVIPHLPPLKPSHLMPTIESQGLDFANEEEADAECYGVLYSPNRGISHTGWKLLEAAERFRSNGGMMTCYPGGTNSPGSPLSRRTSESSASALSMNKRKESFTSQRSTGGGPVDLERLRSKIQGSAIRDQGPAVSALWIASLELLRAGRAILLANKLPGKLSHALWLGVLSKLDAEGVMSRRQRNNVLSWAGDRGTLEVEKEWAGKLTHVQIWRFLECVECLTYEM
ncbi:hypothetical protein SAICODRAFT_70905 [Saitoella complicata NRRL Y-17804]|uniref:uncharacterized protein n=1 Tax=Saitoella complicata (strain BCRC 22490 / CBS 7301 / JCM 7358 / NBRC 10748 / NRRL Y-17804) TaxID=698492 RepID=UPI0008673008|nr:uncharacterized protein SAICODRAFT_70905 [Saitoella complicata NRRL Y-17804]ODQ53306.1 hypothetical protein SAICODRAFT_70905 [Saitoella complicata NRRL Y-17804]